MTRPQKLELTWVGKDDRPQLEPRILLEDAALSYHTVARVSPADQFDNLLIQGDNLLALKALEQEYAGKVKCVFIDPPYNTGSAFAQYDDGVEHSLWLSLLRDRLEIIRSLLADDGSLWITIDDNEAHYLKVLCDEVLGRSRFIANVVWQKRTSRENRAAIGSAHDHVLVYAKAGTQGWRGTRNRLPPNDRGFANPDNDPRGAWRSIPFSAQGYRPNQMYAIETPTGAIVHPPAGRCWGATEPVFRAYQSEKRIYWPKGGSTRPRIKLYAGEEEGLAPMTWWSAEECGDNDSAKKHVLMLFANVEAFATPKPEQLLERIIRIASNPGDLVLDSFLGSGTTAAVAHKMGRRWIGIEMGDHAVTHCVPRLRKVIDGQDPGGVTSQTNWKGGGGFRFLRLAPSLLKRDHWGNWVVSREYNAAMLTEALCKLEGFRYDPSPDLFWQQGKSTERDFLYATTQTLDARQLDWISNEVGEGRSLLVLCRAWLGDADRWPNLTLRKIPNAVLGRCEFGRDDYSLRIAALPAADAPVDDMDAEEASPRPVATALRPTAKRARRASTSSSDQTSLLDDTTPNSSDQ